MSVASHPIFLTSRKVSAIIEQFYETLHCVKSVRFLSFLDLYFSAFWLIFFCIVGKMQTRKTPNMDTFHAFLLSEKTSSFNIETSLKVKSLNEWSLTFMLKFRCELVLTVLLFFSHFWVLFFLILYL